MPQNRPQTVSGRTGPWDAFTDAALFRFLEALLARPLDDPEVHASFCAQLLAELLRRLLLCEPAEGESTAVH